METTTIKVFEVSDDEWVAAEDSESAAAFYRSCVGEATYEELTEEFGGPMELDQDMLNRLRWTDEEAPRTISFAERLGEVLAEGGQFPQYFATGNL